MNQANLISPFLVFFIIHAMQIGVGALTFTRSIAEAAGYQSWIAVICTGIAFHLIIWMLYFILNDQKNDVVVINKSSFGTVLGFVLTALLTAYFIVSSTSILLVYILVVQIWVFPELPGWVLSFAMLLVIYYAVLNGFRTIVGLCFIGVIIPSFLFFTGFYLLDYATFRSLLPLFDTTVSAQLLALKEMTFSYLGPESLLIFYPFIQQAKKSQKFAHMANAVTTFLYLYVMFFTFIFFAEEQVTEVLFPTLTAWKVVNLPFIERFEYLGIAIWMIVIFPNITLAMWGASRLLKRQLNISQRKTLPFVIIASFVLSFFFDLRKTIEDLAAFSSNFGMYVNYIYIPLLFLIIFVKRKMKR